MYHILFIHSSVEGLKLFPPFGFVNNAAMNICIKVWVWMFSVLSQCNCWILLVTFWRPKLFSTVAAQFYILLRKYEGPNFSTSLQYLLPVLLIITILVGVNCYFTEVLICISLMTNVVRHLFTYLLATCMRSLEKCILKTFVVFNWVVCLSITEVVNILYIFWTLDFIRYIIYKYVLPFCCLHFLESVFEVQKVLIQKKYNLHIFILLLVLLVSYLRNH